MVTKHTPELDPVDGLAQLAFLVHGTLERRAGEHGLSVIQARLLGVLRDRRPTMSQLAALLELDKSSVTGLVSRAEDRGLVRRSPATEDRRSVRVALTARGRSLVGAGSAAFAADVEALLARLPVSARATLRTLVSRLLVAHAQAQGVDLFDTVEGGARVT